MKIDSDWAIKLAELLQAGKMIGGDEDDVRNALLAEVKRQRIRIQQCEEILRHAIDVVDTLDEDADTIFVMKYVNFYFAEYPSCDGQDEFNITNCYSEENAVKENNDRQ